MTASDTQQRVRSHLEAHGYALLPENPTEGLTLRIGPDAPRLQAHCQAQQLNATTLAHPNYPQQPWLLQIDPTNTEAPLLSVLDSFRNDYALMFDLDDTLVDTSTSFDLVIGQLVTRHTGETLLPDELNQLRSQGGFNGDWDAARELIRRRGKDLPREQVVEEGIELYLGCAQENEELLVSVDFLKRLGKRYRLFIATGRMRCEYAPIWGEVLDPLFEGIYCRDDVPGVRPKPWPDLMLAVLERHGLKGGSYIGNSVDDMQASLAAGLVPLGVAKNQSVETLTQAGAHWVFNTLDELERVL